jgi:hypothetical protein
MERESWFSATWTLNGPRLDLEFSRSNPQLSILSLPIASSAAHQRVERFGSNLDHLRMHHPPTI